MHSRIVLDNGLRLIINQMPHARSVCVTFILAVGSRYEEIHEMGISHLIEHLCFKGTVKRPTFQAIIDEIEGVGGDINAGTDKEITRYSCRVGCQDTELATDVLSDLLLNSHFSEAAIETEKNVIYEEISRLHDSPQCRVKALIDELLWPNQALGWDVTGNKATVASLNREHIIDFFSRHYIPCNAVLSVAGNVDDRKIIDLVTDLTGGWLPRTVESAKPAMEEQHAPQIRIEGRKTEQAHICLAFHGLSFSQDNRYGLSLLNAILGEGMGSRLAVNVRNRLGLAYDVHSYVNYYSDTGSIVIYAGVHPAQIGTAIKVILEEISYVKERITEEEVYKYKRALKGKLSLDLEHSAAVAGWLGGQELFIGHIVSLDDIFSIIDEFSALEVRDMAYKLLAKKDLNVAIVGPVSEDCSLDNLLGSF